jgi:hypothetical protein
MVSALIPCKPQGLGRILKELQDQTPKACLWVWDEIRQLVEDLHPQGGQRLYTIQKQLPGRHPDPGQNNSRCALEPLLDFLVWFSKSWQNYCTPQSNSKDPGPTRPFITSDSPHEEESQHGSWIYIMEWSGIRLDADSYSHCKSHS